MTLIKFCTADKKFTLKDTCPECGEKTVTTQPPKYSVDDKYGDYRREAKQEERQKEGLL